MSDEQAQEAAPEEPATVEEEEAAPEDTAAEEAPSGDLQPAGESSNPEVQQLIAVRAAYQLNLDQLEDVDEPQIEELKGQIKDTDAALAKLGYEV